MRNQLKFEVLSREREEIRQNDGTIHRDLMVIRLANLEDPRLYGASKIAPIISFY